MKRRVKERTYGVSSVDAGAVLSHRVMLVVLCITLLGTIYIDQSEPSVEASTASSLQKFDMEGASL